MAISSGAAAISADGTFGDRLRELRRAAGLSQEALAERANLALRTVQYLESRAAQRPQRDTLSLVLRALGVDRDTEDELIELARKRSPSAEPDIAWRTIGTSARRPLFGRERDLRRIDAELVRPGIVTLTGTGGVGKTALALESAAHAADRFGGRVAVVALETIVAARCILTQLSTAFGLSASGSRARQLATLASAFDTPTLVVFDGAEHLERFSSILDELIERAPRLTALVTSRVRLGAIFERVLRIEPLAVSDGANESKESTLADDWLRANPAAALFVSAAERTGTPLRLDRDGRRTILDICRALDGLPLAVELAASLSNVLPPVALRARLNDHLHLLHVDAPGIPMRQRSLRATLSWSYELLSHEQRAAFRACGLFNGGASLAALEEMLGHPKAVASVSALVEHNLALRRESASGTYRFSMLDTVRAYANEMIDAVGERDVLERAHARALAHRFESINERLKSDEAIAALAEADDESANLAIALQTCVRAGAAELALRLVTAAQRYWEHRDRSADAREWIERVIACAAPHEAVVPPLLLVRAEVALGANCIAQGDAEAARAACSRARDRAVRAGDALFTGIAVQNLALIALTFDRDYAAAEVLFREALEHLHNPAHRSVVGANLAATLALAGRLDESDALARETLERSEQSGDVNGIATASQQLGANATDRGDIEIAAAAFIRMLACARRLAFHSHVSASLPYIAELAQRCGEHRAAAIVLGYDARLLATLHIVRDPSYELRSEAMRAFLIRRLGRDGMRDALAHGAALDDETAFDFIDETLRELSGRLSPER